MTPGTRVRLIGNVHIPEEGITYSAGTVGVIRNSTEFSPGLVTVHFMTDDYRFEVLLPLSYLVPVSAQ